jgi:hypothetical protein
MAETSTVCPVRKVRNQWRLSTAVWLLMKQA